MGKLKSGNVGELKSGKVGVAEKWKSGGGWKAVQGMSVAHREPRREGAFRFCLLVTKSFRSNMD